MTLGLTLDSKRLLAVFGYSLADQILSDLAWHLKPCQGCLRVSGGYPSRVPPNAQRSNLGLYMARWFDGWSHSTLGLLDLLVFLINGYY